MLRRDLLENMYKKGYSMQEIADRLDVNVRKINYWMEKYKISRRSISEAIYKRHNPAGDPFKIDINLDTYKNFLLGLGLGLFWGEGMKTSRTGVRLGNTDPFVILYFKEFLMTICGVRKEKIKYSLQLFGDNDKKKAVRFWCDILDIQPAFLGKISTVTLRGRGTYRTKNQFGVMQIACHNTKLKEIIDNYLRTLKISSYADVAQLVEHVHGETPKILAQMLRN